ncbi:hypothetical protein NN561_017396 [Cricetulus griseus]
MLMIFREVVVISGPSRPVAELGHNNSINCLLTPGIPIRGQSQFPDSLVEVLTWLWAAVRGREAGQMSRSPGEEAAPRESGQGFWPGKTTSSPLDLALSVWSWGASEKLQFLCVAADSAAASLVPPHSCWRITAPTLHGHFLE